MAKLTIVSESKNSRNKPSNRMKAGGRTSGSFVRAINPFIDDKQLGDL
jgi:hypothetical protein